MFAAFVHFTPASLPTNHLLYCSILWSLLSLAQSDQALLAADVLHKRLKCSLRVSAQLSTYSLPFSNEPTHYCLAINDDSSEVCLCFPPPPVCTRIPQPLHPLCDHIQQAWVAVTRLSHKISTFSVPLSFQRRPLNSFNCCSVPATAPARSRCEAAAVITFVAAAVQMVVCYCIVLICHAWGHVMVVRQDAP